MQVKYIGEYPADLTMLGIHVEPGDEITVDDSFGEHPLFVSVKPKRGGEPIAVTE